MIRLPPKPLPQAEPRSKAPDERRATPKCSKNTAALVDADLSSPAPQTDDDGSAYHQSGHQHPKLDLDVEDVEPLDKHAQGRSSTMARVYCQPGPV